MLGKAVKFRHCPATVSAPVSTPVVLGYRTKAGFQPGLFRRVRRPGKPLEARAACGLVFGKVAEKGVSQETGPRRFLTACVPRGTKEHFMPVFAFARARLSRVFSAL